MLRLGLTRVIELYQSRPHFDIKLTYATTGFQDRIVADTGERNHYCPIPGQSLARSPVSGKTQVRDQCRGIELIIDCHIISEGIVL